MPLNPDIESYLKNPKRFTLPEIAQLTPEEARRLLDGETYTPAAKQPDNEMQITPLTIFTEDTPLEIRIYYPKNKTGLFSGLIYFHGGGFVLGTLDQYDFFCVDIARKGQCAVISVAYRLAPEHPFPTPMNDCYHAAEWIMKNAASLRLDPTRIFISGDSAGGCLAAAVTQMARDLSAPRFAGQILIYPITDFNIETSSVELYGNGSTNMSRATLLWFFHHYLANPSDADKPYAQPLKTKSLADLPDALIITAECDPAHDEGLAYATRLKESHVRCDYYCYPGMIHAFPFFAAVVPSAKKATDDLTSRIAEWIKEK
jgi:acetyl esterase